MSTKLQTTQYGFCRMPSGGSGGGQDIEAIKQDVAELKDGLSNKITKFYASNQGENHITDSDNGKIRDMVIYGKSSQDGTPTVENPVEIKSVVNPIVKVTNADGLKAQSVALNNITLNAIPVETGGNVTIDGQRYVADYVDVERGKLVKMTGVVHPKTGVDMSRYTGTKETVANYRVNVENVAKRHGVLCNMLSSVASMWSRDVLGAYCLEPDAIDFALSYKMLGIDSSASAEQRVSAVKKWLENNDLMVVYVLTNPLEVDLTAEEARALRELVTYYPTTNISTNSEQVDGYTVFNYSISLQNGWNYVKQQLNDTRDYIYDMDAQSAEAYVNSEYAVALTELEV